MSSFSFAENFSSHSMNDVIALKRFAPLTATSIGQSACSFTRAIVLVKASILPPVGRTGTTTIFAPSMVCIFFLSIMRPGVSTIATSGFSTFLSILRFLYSPSVFLLSNLPPSFSSILKDRMGKGFPDNSSGCHNGVFPQVSGCRTKSAMYRYSFPN